MWDEQVNVILFSNGTRNVGVDVEVEMIWIVIVFGVVWSCDGLAGDVVNGVVESVVPENVDWNEYHSVVVVAYWTRQVEVDHCLEVARVMVS